MAEDNDDGLIAARDWAFRPRTERYRTLMAWVVYALGAVSVGGMVVSPLLAPGATKRFLFEGSVAWFLMIAIGLAAWFALRRATANEADEHPLTYRDVRSQIEHEDELIDHRLTWLVTSEGIFFGGFALQFTAQRLNGDTVIFTLLPWVGVATALLIYSTVIGAIGAIHNLSIAFERHGADADFHPRIMGRRLTQLLGFPGPLLIAPGIVFVWTIIIARQLGG